MINIPCTNANWETIAQFALTFNGYKFAGGLEKLGELWDKIVANPENASLDELRACLFFLQRAGRFCGDEGTNYDLQEARAILKFMRDKND